MQEILIKSLMTHKVQCATPSTPLSHVIQSMKQSRHSCKVITEDDRPIGMITERDIVHHFSELIDKGKEHDPVISRSPGKTRFDSTAVGVISPPSSNSEARSKKH